MPHFVLKNYHYCKSEAEHEKRGAYSAHNCKKIIILKVQYYTKFTLAMFSNHNTPLWLPGMKKVHVSMILSKK